VYVGGGAVPSYLTSHQTSNIRTCTGYLGYVLFLFLLQGVLKVLYLQPQATPGASGTDNQTNRLAV